MDIIEQLGKEQIAKVTAGRAVPEFGPGDTVRVSIKVVEGSRERVQVFEGVCIARSNDGINSSFTVRKISYGEGVERVLPLYAPSITKIEVVRRGAVRRAKLYYLRGRTGKRARITEKVERREPRTQVRIAAASDLPPETQAELSAAESDDKGADEAQEKDNGKNAGESEGKGQKK